MGRRPDVIWPGHQRTEIVLTHGDPTANASHATLRSFAKPNPGRARAPGSEPIRWNQASGSSRSEITSPYAHARP